MSLERKKGADLHVLLAGRSKDASSSKLLALPPSALAPLVSPFAPESLKKRKKDKEVAEEGELVPHDEGVPPMISWMAKGKESASSVESKDVKNVAEVCPTNLT